MASTAKRPPQRYQVEMPTRFRVMGTRERFSEAQMRNLSEGGLCIETSQPLNRGDLIEVIAETTDSSGVVHKRLIRARVIWCKDGKAGIQFLRSRPSILKKQDDEKQRAAMAPRPRLVISRKTLK